MSEPPTTDTTACWNCEGFGASHDEAETCCICNGTGIAEWERDPLCHVHPDARHMMETIVRLRAELKQHTGAGDTDTTNATLNATTEAVERLEGDNPHDMDDHRQEGRARAWDDGFERGKEAVLSVPRVAAGLKLLEAVESFELMDPQMSAGRTAQARAVHAGVVAGRNAVLERLRVIAGINDGEVRS